MGEGSNPFGALLGFWMLMQLVSVLLTLIGGLYALWCLNRIASSNEQNTTTLERLTAATERLAQQNGAPLSNNMGASNVSAPVAPPVFPAPMSPVPQENVVQPSPAPVEAVPFTPATPPPPASPFGTESQPTSEPQYSPQTPQSPTEENRPL